MRWLSVAALVSMIPISLSRATVLGGGLLDTDCTVVFEGVAATDADSGVVCTDGDPACDADAAVDGICRFSVHVCTRLAATACTPRDVSSIVVAGLPLEPPVPGPALTCGASTVVAVASGTASGATIVARAGNALKDVDYLNLCCEGRTAPLAAARCALAVDATVAGCTRTVPHAFTAALAKARTSLEQAASAPAEARSALRRAAKRARRMRALARRFAKSDPCGNALGLVANHAIAVLDAARALQR